MVDVDVLLPVRAPRLSWLKETLDSVACQRNVNVRLVAVLHGDDLAARELIEAVSCPVTIFSVATTGTLADVLNAGLAQCTAKYTARIDADDVAEANRLELQCELLEGDPQCAVVGSNATLIDDSGERLGERVLPSTATDIFQAMRWKSAVMHPTVTFRTEVVQSLGGYSRVADHTEDYELWLRVLRDSTIRSVPELLLRYRLHGGQVTQTQVTPRSAMREVRESRLALARSKQESRFMAEVRQLAWSSRQASRHFRRG